MILFLSSTIVVVGQPIGKKNYNWHGYAPFYLSATFTKSFWIDDLLPFGFKLSKQSRVKMDTVEQSGSLPVTDSTFFASATYFFNDSVVQKVRLYPVKDRAILKIRDTLENVLDAYFLRKDFSNTKETVYSDEDLLVSVNIEHNFLEISSLNHQRLFEEVVSVIGLRNYSIDSRSSYSLALDEVLHLSFFNQITKENNVQLAFSIRYNSTKPIYFEEIIFELSEGKKIRFPVKPLKEPYEEKVSRCFIGVEELKRILKSEKVRIILSGSQTRSYLMPDYQRHSLKTALQFYKENVTHPLIHYPGW